MLAELRIENLLLIANAEIEFAAGLNVLTGETGAGKSLLVDALEFLLGARGDVGMVRQGASQAAVSARFILSDPHLIDIFSDEFGIVFDPPAQKNNVLERKNSVPGKATKTPKIQPTCSSELVLSRAMPLTGRPRAHANGRPIALPTLREIGDRLLDVHGQHQNQSLLRSDTRLEILDGYANAWPERAAVRRVFLDAQNAAQALAEIRLAAGNRESHEQMMRFQLKELDEAQLDGLEPQKMESELLLLRNAEKIKMAALNAQEGLDGEDVAGIATHLARMSKTFGSLGDAGPEVAGISERLKALWSEVGDLAQAAAELAEKARSNPERLTELEDRRALIRDLERKHGCDFTGLTILRDKLRADLSDIGQIDERKGEREKALARAVAELQAACGMLSKKRKAASRELEKFVNVELVDLGLKGARIKIDLMPNESHLPHVAGGTPAVRGVTPSMASSMDGGISNLVPSHLKASGAEGVEIVFSANPELPLRPLKDCASGGEISRVMLALKSVLARVAGADRLPVVVFDEIDSGVGGRLGGILGKKLSELAGVRQVICVTHQPQIAAYAQQHLKVEKYRESNTSVVRVECIDGKNRVEELALMLRGTAASDHTRVEAASMLREAGVSPAKTM